ARRLLSARCLMQTGRLVHASREFVLASYALAGATHATWGRLPESTCRGVTRFLDFARSAQDDDLGDAFLVAAGLGDEDVWRRFEYLPDAARRERDVLLATRNGFGEDITVLSATRDLLHIGAHLAIRNVELDEYPEWTGVSTDADTVTSQLEAVELMLDRLVSFQKRLTTG
ncbi:hypothetical protein LCGC14_1153360, partial [marine sediment metagenome]